MQRGLLVHPHPDSNIARPKIGNHNPAKTVRSRPVRTFGGWIEEIEVLRCMIVSRVRDAYMRETTHQEKEPSATKLVKWRAVSNQGANVSRQTDGVRSRSWMRNATENFRGVFFCNSEKAGGTRVDKYIKGMHGCTPLRLALIEF